MLSRRKFVGAAATIYAAGLSSASAEQLPICANREKLGNGWFVRWDQSGFSVSHSRVQTASLPSVTTPAKVAQCNIIKKLSDGRLVISVQMDSKFRAGGIDYTFVEFDDAGGKSIRLAKGSELIRPDLVFSVLIDGNIVKSQFFLGLKGISLGEVGNIYFAIEVTDQEEVEKIETLLKSAADISVALFDYEKIILDGTPVIYGVHLRLDGFEQAWDVGLVKSKQTFDSFSAGKCVELKGCFITTACCELFMRPDNCWELNTLRRFRDNVLAKSERGKLEIERYYQIAPELVSAIKSDGRRGTLVLAKIYALTILPCAVLVTLKCHKMALILYRSMCAELIRTYSTPAKSAISVEMPENLS